MTTLSVPKTPVQTPPHNQLVAWIWRDRRIGWVVAVGVAAVAGLASALVMPRGPITSGLALGALATGVTVGFVAGLALRSRWAMLLAPLVFVAVFELGRWRTEGPLVDGIRLGTLRYGFQLGTIVELGAVVLGRGFHGVIALVPMVLGAAYGTALARRLAPLAAMPLRLRNRIQLYGRRGVTALLTVALLALAGLIARPAHTDPILGSNGAPLPGSVAEIATVPIGGHDQVLLIRGTRAGVVNLPAAC